MTLEDSAAWPYWREKRMISFRGEKKEGGVSLNKLERNRSEEKGEKGILLSSMSAGEEKKGKRGSSTGGRNKLS